MKSMRMLKFSKYLFVKNNPVYVTFFATNRCNLKCRHCFYWKGLNTKKREMSLEEIKKFSRNLKDILVLSLTGGETSLRKDLPEIVRIFYENTRPEILSINTNGYLKEKIVNDIKKILEFYKSPLIIELSLDGIKEDHDRIRGVKGSFENALRTFMELRKLEKTNTNLSLSINITFSKLNQNKARGIINFIQKKLKPDWLNMSLIRGDVKEKEFKDVKMELFMQCINLVNDYNKKYGKHNFSFSSINKANQIFVNNLICKTAKENKYQIPCFAGCLSCVVYEDGNVYPCEMLARNMGNLREYDYNLRKMLKSKNAEKISKEIRKKKCFCTHECVATINTLFNPRVLPRVFFSYPLNHAKLLPTTKK